jgi:hypothetical protein
MAPRYPAAEWRPLGTQTQPRMTSHDVVCLHTMVGSLDGTDNYFHDSGYGGTESHFGVGHEGRTIQWQDISHTADANLDGKYRVLSIETADFGPGFPDWNTNDASQVPAWTPAQLERLAHLVAWLCDKATHAECPSSMLCRQHGIPLYAIPNSQPHNRGVGWHRQGVDSSPLYQYGYRVPGGEKWSQATGKVCPGDRRIAQIPGIIARARQIAAGQSAPTPTPPVEDDDMQYSIVGDAGRGGPAYAVSPVSFTAISGTTFATLHQNGFCKYEINMLPTAEFDDLKAFVGRNVTNLATNLDEMIDDEGILETAQEIAASLNPPTPA